VSIEVEVAAHNELVVAVNVVIVASVEVRFSIVPLVAVKSVAVTSVQVNVPSAVMLPLKVTSHSIVSSVTLLNSSSSKFSITVLRAPGSREML
jgi:hypothetical protein